MKILTDWERGVAKEVAFCVKNGYTDANSLACSRLLDDYHGTVDWAKRTLDPTAFALPTPDACQHDVSYKNKCGQCEDYEQRVSSLFEPALH